MNEYNGIRGKNNKNDNDSHPFYPEIGSRTDLIVKLIKRQYSAAVAEAIAFSLLGNPLKGGGSNG